MVKLRVAIHGKARYSSQRAFASQLAANLGGTAEQSFVPDVDEGFFVFRRWTIDHRPWSVVNGPSSDLKGGTNEKRNPN